MDAMRLGPLVISAPRLYAAVGLLLLIIVAELVAWRARARATDVLEGSGADSPGRADAGWAWNAALAAVVGARLGFVLENLGYYADAPLQAFAFWQGGFSHWWGVAAGAGVALGTLLRQRQPASRLLLPAAVALSVWLLVPQLLSPASGQAVALPATTLERLEGGALDLGQAAGGATVVNLWASWCVPCRRELPALARAAQEHPGVRFLYVNQGESREAVTRYLEAHVALERSSVLLDPRQAVGSALGSVGLPTTYFFDAAGNHVKTHVGEISGPALDRELRALNR